MSLVHIMRMSLVWVAAWKHVDVQGLYRTGYTSRLQRALKRRTCTSLGQHSEAGSAGRGTSELNLRVSVWD